MSEYQTVAVPFELLGNRQVITDRQIAEMGWLMDFIERFPKCFERSEVGFYYVFYPEGDSPAPIEVNR